MLPLSEIHTRLSKACPQAVAALPGDTPSADPEIQIDPLMLHFIGQELLDDPDMAFSILREIQATPQAQGCTLRYRIHSPSHGQEITLRIEVGCDTPIVLTVADLWPEAQWHEDEIESTCHIQFQTHPDCTNPNCRMHGRGTRCMRLTGAPAPFEP
jgi:hypothetical protein